VHAGKKYHSLPHGQDGQHQYVDRTTHGRVNQNDREQRLMEKVHPWCGQPSDQGWLKNRTKQRDVRSKIQTPLVKQFLPRKLVEFMFTTMWSCNYIHSLYTCRWFQVVSSVVCEFLHSMYILRNDKTMSLKRCISTASMT